MIRYFYPLWGSEDLPMADFFARVKDEGYAGVEMNIPYDASYLKKLRKLLDSFQLKLIAQQYLPPLKETFSEYMKRLVRYTLHLIRVEPLFINSHSGKDYFTFEENCQVVDYIDSISKKYAITILHETHRGRFLFSTLMAHQYFEKYPDLRITADFSHWCCVSESLLQDQQEIVNQAIDRADHIHARVGFENGPQINHPMAPENANILETHLCWWKAIAAKKRKNKQDLSITTEFGPYPYMPHLPFVNQPIVDQWKVNLSMKSLLEKELLI